MWVQDPPFQTLATNLLLFFLSCTLPFAVYCSGQFSVQNLCQTALKLQSELSDCSCILSWSHSTIWHDILVLTNLQGFTKNKISHQHKQATFLLLRVKTAVFDLAVHFQSKRTRFENAQTKRRRRTKAGFVSWPLRVQFLGRACIQRTGCFLTDLTAGAFNSFSSI